MGGTYGVFVNNSPTVLTNVSVKNLIVSDWTYGIRYYYVENSTTSIRNNTLSSNGNGIALSYSNNITLADNNFTSNGNGIYLYSSAYNTITGNNASSNSYGIRFESSSNNTLTNNEVSHNTVYGMYLVTSSKGNTIDHNNVSSNGFEGLFILRSNNNIINNNTATSNKRRGIYLTISHNNTVSNNSADSNLFSGIQLDFSEDNVLSNNAAGSNSLFGIYLYYSIGNTLNGNVMAGNIIYNFYVWGVSISHFIHTIETSNIVDGKPIYYFVGASDKVVNASSNAGFVGAVSSLNITVRDSILVKNGQGVLIVNTTNSSIENITASNNSNGIYLLYSNNNNISNSTTTNNSVGISLSSSNYNTITDSTSSSNIGDGISFSYSNNNLLSNSDITANPSDGIYVSGGSDNRIEDNILDLNGDGVYLTANDDMDANTVIRNWITNSTFYGIYVDDADDDSYSSNFNIADNVIINSSYGIYFDSGGYDVYDHKVYNNTIVNASSDGIHLDDSDVFRINITGNRIQGSGSDGIYIWGSDSNTITGNNITNTSNNGVYISFSDRNNITGNNIIDYCTGIYIFRSSFNNVLNNTIMHSRCGGEGSGVYVDGGGGDSDNIFRGNMIGWNYYGLYLWFEERNLVEGNTFTDNSYGAYLRSSWNNTIYNNYFRNTINAYEGFTSQSSNYWNTTYQTGTNIVGGQCLGGNYWSDYLGTDTEADGIGNTLLPYNTSTLIGQTPGRDYLPLLMPPATFNNTVQIRNGTTETVMETGCPFDVRIQGTANDTGSATMGVLGQTSSEGATFEVFEINSSTSGAETGVKYLRITNSTGLDNITRIRIEVHYTDAEIAGLDEGSLALFYWDPNTLQWLNTMKFKGTNMTPTGPFVFDAGRNTGGNYVYAVVDHFSVYGVGGNFPTPSPTPSGGGGGGFGLPAGADVLIVANSIDIGLAEEFLDFLRQNNIDTTIVNSTEFTEAKKVENRQIIILGGPDSPEGIGEIVSGLLDDDEMFEVRQPGSQTMNLKINVWTGRYVYKQRVLILAGSDRTFTKLAIAASLEEVKTQLLRD